MCGGLNGCPTRTRSGRLHFDCMTLGVIPDELDAMSESTGAASSMSANSFILNSGRSGAFSEHFQGPALNPFIADHVGALPTEAEEIWRYSRIGRLEPDRYPRVGALLSEVVAPGEVRDRHRTPGQRRPLAPTVRLRAVGHPRFSGLNGDGPQGRGYSCYSAKTGVAVISEASNEKPWPPVESDFSNFATACAVLEE